MRRKISSELHGWKNRKSHKALVVTGCRQIGKTYSLEEFAKSEYQDYIYINFEQDPATKDIFHDALDVDSLIERIAFWSGKSIDPEKHLLFLDEIGCCPEAFSSLKWFTNDGRYDVIASGSLLGVLLPEIGSATSPAGYIDIIHMRPMDFEEFLWAMNVSEKHIEGIRKAIYEKTPIDSFILKMMHSLYRRFLVVGGMPEAVRTYAASQDYPRTRKVQENTLALIRNDVAQHSRKPDKLKIIACMDSIPSQLAKENNIFQYVDVSKSNASGRKYSSALGWLFATDVALKAVNVSEPRSPLDANEREDSFKVYMHDCGLLLSMMDYQYAYDIVTKDPMANNGALMECATASALHNAGYKVRFFRNKTGTMELDFVIRNNEGITAIEVKSGKKKRASSLRNAGKSYGINCIKLAEGNILTDDLGILHLPLFAPWFFSNEIPQLDILDYSALKD